MKKFFTLCLLLGMAVVFINADNDELYHSFANEQVLLDELDLFEYANFPDGTSFEIFQDEVDDLGIRHQSYQQMYHGIKVQSKMILVHSKNGQLLSLNGNVMKQDVAPKTIKQNLNKLQARKKVNSDTDEKDITLTILCINGIYYTVYKVPNPETLETFYIDAESGEIVYVEPALQSADVKTQALTRYSGWQEMTMYETDGKYVFLDSARNIVTLGAKGGLNYDYYFSQDFILSLPDSILQKIINGDTATIQNSVYSPMLWDYINQCNILYNNSPVIYIPTITNITITNANSSWWYDIWDTKPDIFIEIYNSNNQLVYVSPTINDATFPISFPMSVVVSDGYVIQIYDEDATGSSYGGGIKISTTEPGAYSWSNSSTTSGMLTITEASTEYADIHWGMQKTYDFYKNIFKRNSFDNKGHIIYNIAFPEYDDKIFKTMPTNAFAQHSYEPYFMAYGVGDGTTMNPVVALDVMAHEFTHLVTAQNGKGGLDYVNESGALNESFSDIMAIGVEKFTFGNADWTIAEDLMIKEPYMRSIKEPTSAGQPDTYGKGLWIPSTSTPNDDNDQGGVHTNSGVQNFWFYLLSEGGTGTNDNNEKYTVKGIGIDKALQIAYRTLIHYLTPSATFANARQSSLQAARDLYGANSTEEIAVTNAWHAVGVGDKYIEEPQDSDLTPGKYIIVANREEDSKNNWYYMTSDLGTASTKRFQAVSASTENIDAIATSNLDAQYIWELEADGSNWKLKNGDQYATWKSGNSANLDATGKSFTFDITDNQVVVHFNDGSAERYLSLHTGNDYFAFYGNTGQIEQLYFLPYEDKTTPSTPERECKSVPYTETFASSQGDFTVYNALLPSGFTSIWNWSSQYGMVAKCIKGSTKYASEAYLISPCIELPENSQCVLTFSHAAKFFQDTKQMSLWISTNYDETNPESADWDRLVIPTYPTGDNWNWFESGAIDLSSYSGKNVNIAFCYTSTESYAPQWEIKNFAVKQATTTVLENIDIEKSTSTKILHNGQLLILRDGKTYNVMGQEL